jgi:malate dehydrogenase (oxaloacetate-decarboxylating)
MTPALLVAAVEALAAAAPVVTGSGSGLLPDVEDVREISVQIARNVIKKAVEDDLAQEEHIPKDDKDLEEWIREQMWNAEYRPLELVEKQGANAHAKGEMGPGSQHREARF